jgi:hypothetical protein
LSQRDAAPLSPTSRLEYKSLLTTSHGFLEGHFILLGKDVRLGDKVELLFVVPDHALKYSGTLALIGAHTTPRQSIKNGGGSHDALIVLSLVLGELPHHVCLCFLQFHLVPFVVLD